MVKSGNSSDEALSPGNEDNERLDQTSHDDNNGDEGAGGDDDRVNDVENDHRSDYDVEEEDKDDNLAGSEKGEEEDMEDQGEENESNEDDDPRSENLDDGVDDDLSEKRLNDKNDKDDNDGKEKRLDGVEKAAPELDKATQKSMAVKAALLLKKESSSKTNVDEPEQPPLSAIVVVHNDEEEADDVQEDEEEGFMQEKERKEEKAKIDSRTGNDWKSLCSFRMLAIIVVLIIVLIAIGIVAAIVTAALVDNGGTGNAASTSVPPPAPSPPLFPTFSPTPAPTVIAATVQPATVATSPGSEVVIANPTTQPTETSSGEKTSPPVPTSTNESPPLETELPRILQDSFSPYLVSYQDALFWNTSSPQQCALDWMLQQDEHLRVNLSHVEDPVARSRKMAERYAMAVFFYQTQEAECDGSQLVDRDISNWDFVGKELVFMDPTLDVCQWYSPEFLGVRCQDPAADDPIPYVVMMNFASVALDGSLPDEIVVLQSLDSLFFFGSPIVDSQLQGSLPTVLAQMPNLSIFFLRFQSLTGTIPSNLFGELAVPLRLAYFNVMSNLFSGPLPEVAVENGLQELIVVQLSGNFQSPSSGLTGTIPDSWKNLVNVQTVDLSTNRLTGTIPSDFARLKRLNILDLSHNFLEGSIPQKWGRKLDIIRMSHNDLVGELPISWRSSLRLTDIDLSFNPRLLNGTGTIPKEFGELRQLETLNLQGIDELRVPSLDYICEEVGEALTISVSCNGSEDDGSNVLCKCCACP